MCKEEGSTSVEKDGGVEGVDCVKEGGCEGVCGGCGDWEEGGCERKDGVCGGEEGGERVWR